MDPVPVRVGVHGGHTGVDQGQTFGDALQFLKRVPVRAFRGPDFDDAVVIGVVQQ